tara:strand:+ start:8359 stop:8823 length:465 start_codon:yes stop_codon:yes gene_type:complete
MNPSIDKVIGNIIKAKNNGAKIVFTNGCFDILHVGHVRYLQKAKEMGTHLVVGLNDDASVSRLKGASRPINKLDDRLELLLALKSVSYVLAFGEDTPRELIQEIKPDVLVKGGDYKINEIIGCEFVQSYGGQVSVINFYDNYSSSKVIAKIKND